MFNQLQDRILLGIKKIRGQHKISESNIDETLRDIRLSLLEADVNFKVVKGLLERVKAKAVGQEVLKSLNPGQQFIKIFHDELVTTLGTSAVDLDCRAKPSIIFLVGLQGAGKTTTAVKLALHIRQTLGKKPGLVPADIYRPAAIDQLQTLAKQVQVPCFPSQTSQRPADIVSEARAWAEKEMVEVLLVDTAGRLQVDEPLMQELKELKELAHPQEILLVADAMLGQQAVQVAEGFHKRLALTGLVLTKVDGDARGGAALSIREVTGVPIKFFGVGEKVAALEVFHPDRLAKRILDMGDVLTLAEKAQSLMDEKTAHDSARRVLSKEFSLDDFLGQIQMLKKMGGIESILKFLPGAGQLQKQMQGMAPPDRELKKIEAIIHSMTIRERKDPRILNASRRERIAKGSGTQVQDINKLVRQFDEAKKMMGQMMKMARGKLPF
ncbi:MAG: signal recognition particle protein [Bdellovibrio sp.]|nr:MAG: signal recognition particle protein [Bdellovibrio sp.]